MSKKNFFYRVNPNEVLGEAIFHENKGEWFMQFFRDLKNDDPDTAQIPMAAEIIKEARRFREKRSFAGKASGEQRANKKQHMLKDVKHMLTDVATNVQQTSTISSTIASTESIPETTSESKDLKEGSRNAQDKPSLTSPKKQLSDDEWLSSLKANPAYWGMDIDREMNKMQAWCMTNQCSPSRKRFINWLNRVDKPLQPGARDRPKSYREQVNDAAVDAFVRGDY